MGLLYSPLSKDAGLAVVVLVLLEGAGLVVPYVFTLFTLTRYVDVLL